MMILKAIVTFIFIITPIVSADDNHKASSEEKKLLSLSERSPDSSRPYYQCILGRDVNFKEDPEREFIQEINIGVPHNEDEVISASRHLRWIEIELTLDSLGSFTLDIKERNHEFHFQRALDLEDFDPMEPPTIELHSFNPVVEDSEEDQREIEYYFICRARY